MTTTATLLYDRALQFGAWLTQRKQIIISGSTQDASPMAKAVVEFQDANPPYQDLAIRTKSGRFHGDKVSMAEFSTSVDDAIAALKRLDGIKKALFYGREFEAKYPIQLGHENCASLHWNWADSKSGDAILPGTAIDIIHSILGKATESGESLELLKSTIENGNIFDSVNFHEEMFDGQWYDAIGCAATGYTFEQGQERNIAKLRERFPDKFTEDKAINRDHAAERVVLEGKTVESIAHPIDSSNIPTDKTERQWLGQPIDDDFKGSR